MPPTTSADSTATFLDGEAPSNAVVELVADANGVSPVDIETPLYEAIDPDALDRFVASTDAASDTVLEIVFTYAGHEVTVRGDGTVVLSDA